MNPSRLGINVDKQIDEWHFRFNQKVVPARVYIYRARDAQQYPGEGLPRIHFYAKFDAKDLEKAKVDPTKFAAVSLHDEDINKLRQQCQDHIQHMLALDWKKVIVVAFKSEIEKDTKMDEHRRDPAVEFSFDYTVAFQSGDFFHHEEWEDSACYFLRSAKEVLGGYSWDEADLHIFDFDEQLLATLQHLKHCYGDLNQRVADLIKPKNIHMLMANLRTMLPATT